MQALTKFVWFGRTREWSSRIWLPPGGDSNEIPYVLWAGQTKRKITGSVYNKAKNAISNRFELIWQLYFFE
jgi:hypothetical protein